MDARTPTLPSTASPTGDQFSYSRDHLLDRARAMVPLLSERAIDTSESRRIPEKTISDFWEAGLFQLLKPKKFNGPEVRADTVFEIAAILAKGDGSAAWVLEPPSACTTFSFAQNPLPRKRKKNSGPKTEPSAHPASPPTAAQSRPRAVSPSPENGPSAAA